MSDFSKRGETVRETAKALVLDFMQATPACRPSAPGMRLAEIFRECGFDWGDYPKATSSNQQYWVVALVRELESEGKVEQLAPSGPWRLRKIDQR